MLLDFITQVINNRTITIPVLSWFIAQSLKVAGVILKEKRFDFTRFVGSGGMPSSHSAFIVSLAVVIGKNKGWNSEIFGLALAVALIVMYDAAGVRRAAGKQAKVLNRLVFSHYDKAHFDEKLKELIGHTPFEVMMGAVLGTLMGIVLG